MWDQRRHVNLLYDHGHPEARQYPFGMLWDEALLVTERLNNMAATQAVLVQQAVSSVLSEKAQKSFKKAIKDLTS